MVSSASSILKLATLTATGENSLFYSIYISCLYRLALSAKPLNRSRLAIYFLYISLVSLRKLRNSFLHINKKNISETNKFLFLSSITSTMLRQSTAINRNSPTGYHCNYSSSGNYYRGHNEAKYRKIIRERLQDKLGPNSQKDAEELRRKLTNLQGDARGWEIYQVLENTAKRDSAKKTTHF